MVFVDRHRQPTRADRSLGCRAFVNTGGCVRGGGSRTVRGPVCSGGRRRGVCLPFQFPQRTLGGFTNDSRALLRVEMLLREGSSRSAIFCDAECEVLWPATHYEASAGLSGLAVARYCRSILDGWCAGRCVRARISPDLECLETMVCRLACDRGLRGDSAEALQLSKGPDARSRSGGDSGRDNGSVDAAAMVRCHSDEYCHVVPPRLRGLLGVGIVAGLAARDAASAPRGTSHRHLHRPDCPLPTAVSAIGSVF